jgi:uncharacterized membrane protein YeaQ/YmgE (transglycosylase-associated protein family)
MTTFARIVLDPGTLAAWLVLGAVCAWLATKMMDEGSYGMMGELIFGILGAFAGGCVYGLLVHGEPAFWGTALVAVLGACAFIGGARLIAAARRVD